MKRQKHAISVLIWKNEDDLLVVKRPHDDEDLPNAWGLPAGSLRKDESYEEAVRRAGREKLDVRLEVEQIVNEGNIEREDYILHMRLYEATIVKGKVSVPQPVEGITQYVAWKWARPKRLRPAAEQGSLCSTLALQITGE